MDDAQCGPEWPLKCTIPDFKKNCVIKFTLEDNDRFTIFGRCLFGLGSTYWNEVLSEIAGRTNADFDEAITLCLEKVAQVQNLQDSILRWVSKWQKPFVFPLKELVRCCEKMYCFASSPYTGGSVPIPTKELKRETLFFVMCKPHQEEFAKMHQDTESVTHKQMLTFFEGCHCQDLNSGRTVQLKASHEEKCCKVNSKHHNGGPSNQGQGQ